MMIIQMQDNKWCGMKALREPIIFVSLFLNRMVAEGASYGFHLSHHHYDSCHSDLPTVG